MSNKKLHMEASSQNLETTKMWINVLESFIFKEILLGNSGIIWTPLFSFSLLPTNELPFDSHCSKIYLYERSEAQKGSEAQLILLHLILLTPVKELGTEKESNDWNWIWGLSVAASQPMATFCTQPGQPFKKKLAEKDNTFF